MIRATLAALSVVLLAVLLAPSPAEAMPAHDRGHGPAHPHMEWAHHHKATLKLLGIH